MNNMLCKFHFVVILTKDIEKSEFCGYQVLVCKQIKCNINIDLQINSDDIDHRNLHLINKRSHIPG